MSKKSLGQIGEDIAAQYLKEKGYEIIERNYRKPWGEIDIIAKKADKIIFFEVKTLRCIQGESSFLPEESVNRKKKINFKKTAGAYLNEKRISKECQIDVIGITCRESDRCCLRHTKNAF